MKQPEARYPLTIEKEVFWRRGAPVTRGLSEASEKHLPVDQPVTKWLHDPATLDEDGAERTVTREAAPPETVAEPETNRVKVCRTETVCKLRYKEGHAHRARIRNMVLPLHYDKGMLSVPDRFLGQVRQAVDSLGGKQNFAIKFIAYTDNVPLKGQDEQEHRENRENGYQRTHRAELG